jgi:predicted enzyme related to lactoylglutathione lyase
MTSRLSELCIDAADPAGLARFWADLLGRPTSVDGLTVLPDADPGIALRFLHRQEPRSGPGQVHLHLTSATDDAQRATVDRVVELGGQHLDVGQLPEEGHVVLADPEGNELCVIEAGNSFLAGCGFLGELACDGTRDVGVFWGAALGWPLVWDEDEETAVQSPRGGAKIAWGGPPVRPRTTRPRMHFHLSPSPGADLESEVARLESLGARPSDSRHEDGHDRQGGVVVMVDPDGNEFCVVGAP